MAEAAQALTGALCPVWPGQMGQEDGSQQQWVPGRGGCHELQLQLRPLVSWETQQVAFLGLGCPACKMGAMLLQGQDSAQLCGEGSA